MEKRSKEPSLISLIVLSAFASIGAIIVTPGIPSIAAFFHVRAGAAQFTMTAFLLGYALGQLIYGPIANRWGRKPAIYIGVIVATLGSLFSIVASPVESFPLLIFGRVLEALGSSVGLVICFTIINDFYLPEHIRRITGLLMVAFAIVPGIGIAAGGVLVQHFGWESCFYFLLFYGLVLLLLSCYLPETLKKKDFNALHHHYLFKNYLKAIRIKRLTGYSLVAGFSAGCLYVFSIAGPFIGIHLLGFSPSAYGMVGLFPYTGTLIGSIIMIKTSHFSSEKMIAFGITLEILAALISLLCFSMKIVTTVSLLGPIGLLFVGNAILYGNAVSLAIRQSHDKANASAVANFLALSSAMLITIIFNLFHHFHPWMMPTTFLACFILMGMVYLLFLREPRD